MVTAYWMPRFSRGMTTERISPSHARDKPATTNWIRSVKYVYRTWVHKTFRLEFALRAQLLPAAFDARLGSGASVAGSVLEASVVGSVRPVVAPV